MEGSCVKFQYCAAFKPRLIIELRRGQISLLRSLRQGRCGFGVGSPESSILLFSDYLSTDVYSSYFSGAKAFYFGNSRIS